MAAYYPRKSATIDDVLKEFEKFDLVGYNEEELQRVEDVNLAKMRGKGAPKKKRTAAGTYSYLALDHLHTVSNEYNRRKSWQEGRQEVMMMKILLAFYCMYIMIPSTSIAEYATVQLDGPMHEFLRFLIAAEVMLTGHTIILFLQRDGAREMDTDNSV